MNKKSVILLLMLTFAVTTITVIRAADTPEKIVIDAIKNKKPPVELNHQEHAERSKGCTVCHHKMNEGEAPKKCGSCHTEEAQGELVSLSKAYHDKCKDCHKEKDSKAPTKCIGCHKGNKN